jgi:putative transposase
MKKSRFTDSQILAVLKQAEAGTPVPQLCREYSISSATFYKWLSKFGGMDASLMSQLTELQDENWRLKKMYADAQLSAELLKEPRAAASQDLLNKCLYSASSITVRSFSRKGDYENTPTRSARLDRSSAVKAADDYARWIKAEVDQTADRVANGEAKLFTLDEAKARGETKRAELLKRRKATV